MITCWPYYLPQKSKLLAKKKPKIVNVETLIINHSNELSINNSHGAFISKKLEKRNTFSSLDVNSYLSCSTSDYIVSCSLCLRKATSSQKTSNLWMWRQHFEEHTWNMIDKKNATARHTKQNMFLFRRQSCPAVVTRMASLSTLKTTKTFRRINKEMWSL